MDACSVFAFVLPGEISRKYVGARSLAQEVQASLLSYLCFALFPSAKAYFQKKEK